MNAFDELQRRQGKIRSAVLSPGVKAGGILPGAARRIKRAWRRGGRYDGGSKRRDAMLLLKPNCECCDKDLPPTAIPSAMVSGEKMKEILL